MSRPVANPGETSDQDTPARLESNRLPMLAAEVKDKFAASATAERSAIDLALAAGAALCEAKDICKHGEWLPFLDAAGVQERKAQRYMKLARSGLKSDTVSDLGGIKAALRWLDRLQLPGAEEYLMVSLDEFAPETSGALAIIWQKTAGPGFIIFNLDPRDDWAKSFARPVIETEHLWPDLFSLLDHRCGQMDFCLVPKAEEIVRSPRARAAS